MSGRESPDETGHPSGFIGSRKYARYVWYTVIGFVIVGSLTGLLTQNASSGVVALGAVIAAAILNLGILFLMVQSLIEEWFEAAEVHEQ